MCEISGAFVFHTSHSASQHETFKIIANYGYLMKSAEETGACMSVEEALSKQGHVLGE